MTWEDAWQQGRTRWDAGGSPPELRRLLEDGSLPEGRALVPGCGSGYDVLALAGSGRPTVGLEVAPTAIARFRQLRDEAEIDPAMATVELEDFFEHSPEAPYDLVWDYTFLCALPPGDRGAWARRVDELLSDRGELVTLIFPVWDRPPDEGPPYPITPELVRDLVADFAEVTYLEPVARSHPGREGHEWLGRFRRRPR